MSGMDGLGRVFNVVPIADAVVLKFRGASAVSYICTGADSYVVTVGTSHAAAATDPGNIIKYYYKTTAVTDGTVAWSKWDPGGTAWTGSAANIAAADATCVVAGACTSVFTVYGSQIPDTYKYIKCASVGAGLVTALFHDLTVQRTPANLEILNV